MYLSLKSSIISLVLVLGLGSLVLHSHAQDLRQGSISKDSSLIIGWANHVSVQRGYINISDTSAMDQDSHLASAGDSNNAIGQADGSIVSLGDGGIATYTLNPHLSDTEGPDFAVFENGFKEQTPPYLWFLELAVVEVSSDGVSFTRFPCVSNTQTATQVATFGQLHPDSLYNLAGKYPVFEGTPFDLDELKDSSNIDIYNITHIRIIDVVGSLNSTYCTRDVNENMINDPFPTPFFSGGFDLDAVAVLGASSSGGQRSKVEGQMSLYPNPVAAGEAFYFDFADPLTSCQSKLCIYDLNGRVLRTLGFGSDQPSIPEQRVKIPNLRPGIYFVVVQAHERKFVKRLIVQ